jgi:iron complex outermembrane receptor protein
VLAAAAACAAAATPSHAQDGDTRRGSSASLLEEVVVTARKREESAQDVPLSISAFGADQIEALKIRDLTNLTAGMPNVALDDVGTSRGTANFSIRGLGINSSIASIEPTVGVFVNGIYLGLNNGIIFDVFDLESIEVLRGPQGVLFGRNVTGGAILMNTRKPGDSLEATLRAAVDGGGDGGWNRYLMGSIGGPVTDTLGLKLTAYLNDDDGWHENQFNGADVQAVEQRMLRGTLNWSPTDRSELVLRYENTDIQGDGPVAQSHENGFGIPGSPFNADRDSFDASYDLIGEQDVQTDFFTAQFDYDVDFGEGVVTALYGWRDSELFTYNDIDSQPRALFHSPSDLTAEQHSFELRYNGNFDNANVTVGGYWFDNDIEYHERRELLELYTATATGGVISGEPFAMQDGGGLYGVQTRAIFANVDYALTKRLTLSAGARWSDEEKKANIATVSLNTNVLDVAGSLASGVPVYVNSRTGTDTRCNVVRSGDCLLDFNDADSWTTLAPKLGLAYALSDEAQAYAHWSRGFRSGGYSLRNTSPTAAPGPFDEEQVDSLEAGYKTQQRWGYLNAAVFYNTIEDMQRDINVPDPTTGIVQITANTADATIRGLELDGALRVRDNFLLRGSLGVLDASYDSVRFDLNGDGVIDDADRNLDLPRAPELTYSVGMNYDFDLGTWATATIRLDYAYRDEVAYTDNNRGFILEQDILDAGLDIYSYSGRWVLSLYGRNLLDAVKHGGDSQLPARLSLSPEASFPLGGTFAPLAKGGVYGAELTLNF